MTYYETSQVHGLKSRDFAELCEVARLCRASHVAVLKDVVDRLEPHVEDARRAMHVWREKTRIAANKEGFTY